MKCPIDLTEGSSAEGAERFRSLIKNSGRSSFLNKRCRTALMFVAVLIMTMAFALSGTNAYADDQYEVLILDDVNLLTDKEEELLKKEMTEKILPYGNAIFSSTDDTGSLSSEKYGEKVYFEHFGNEPGVHLQIDMKHREISLSCSTEAEKVLKKERDSIVDNIYRLASGENYYGCASECFEEINSIYRGEQISHKMKYINNLLLALMAGLLINYIVAFATSRKKAKKEALMGTVIASGVLTGANRVAGKKKKTYSPSSSSGGGRYSGGGRGGGGGFSGGSSSHGF